MSISTGKAQTGEFSLNPPAVDIGYFKDYLNITPAQTKIVFRDSAVLDIHKIPRFNYVTTGAVVPADGRLPDHINNKHIYVQLCLVNSSYVDQEVVLYAGFYFKSKHLFMQSRLKAGEPVVALRDRLPNVEGADHYRVIRLKARDTSIFYLQLQPVRNYGNLLDVQILRPHFLKNHGAIAKGGKNPLDIITYILVGVLFMMLLFSLANFFIIRRQEFVYYFYYSGVMALWLFLKTYLHYSASDFNYFFEEYLDFIIQLVGFLFYVYFLRSFLNVEERYPRLYKIMLGLELTILAAMFLYSSVYFFTDNLYLLGTIELAMRYLLLAGAAMFVIFGLKERNPVMNYIILGNAAQVIFSTVSLLILAFPALSNRWYKDALFYYDLGIVCEMAFFLLGLTYKNRMELMEKFRKEGAKGKDDEKQGLEKQIALMEAQQQERNRISADMHDELGGGMTAIRLMSEIAKQRSYADQIPEIEKISLSANDLLGKMNAIIWSMSLANDSLPNLVAYTRRYALEFYENTPIHCEVNVKKEPPLIELAGIKRRNLFFAIKEVLNNTVKNNNVTRVTLSFKWDKKLKIAIRDDGDNLFADKRSYFDNSFNQIKNRMQAIGGSYHAFYKNGNLIIFTLDL